MKSVFVLVLLCAVSWAALDQSYVQTFNSSGTSIISKTMDISVFSGTLTYQMLSGLSNNCQLSSGCSFDQNTKIITLSEIIGPEDGYYTFTADYGFPFISYTLQIDKIPNDKFSTDLTRMMGRSGGFYQPTDLNKNNMPSSLFLKNLNANVTYSVNVPGSVDEATAGSVKGAISGSMTTFNFLDVLGQQGPITIKSHELNLTYIIILLCIIAVAAIAVSFRKTGKAVAEKPEEPKKKKKGIK